jgi:cation diffusion facilitator family transporter
MEVLGGLVNSTFLLAVCLLIFFDAVERFIDPPSIEQPLLFLVVGGIGMVTNVIGLFLFRNHGHSDNIRGVFLHVLGDFFGSIGVIVTAFLYYFSDWEPKKYADPLFSILIVFMLVKSSLDLFKRTAWIVAERCPDTINTDEVAAELLKIDGLLAVHELHIWELSKGCLLALLHLVVDSKDHNRSVLEHVHNLMIGYAIYSTTVQIEFIDDFPDGVDHVGHCFYASSYGTANRAFVTPPVYRHVVGCPHLNSPDQPAEHNDHHHERDHGHAPKAGKAGMPGKGRPATGEELPLKVQEDPS